MQAHDFFSDAKEAAADAKDAVKDEAERAGSRGPSRTVPRPSGLYGKDAIPSNTEDVEHWRRTHPWPARGNAGSDAVEGVKQAAKDTWGSVKGQTQEAAQAAKGNTKQAAQHAKGKVEDVKEKANKTADQAKGKAEDVKGKANETADQAKDKADEAADGFAGWAKSWFGKSTPCCTCCTMEPAFECWTYCLEPQLLLHKETKGCTVIAQGLCCKACNTLQVCLSVAHCNFHVANSIDCVNQWWHYNTLILCLCAA